MSLALSLFGTVLSDASSSANAQERSAAVGVASDGVSSSSSKRDRDESGVEVRPDHPWEDRENSVGQQLLKNIAQDQKALWIGPKSVRLADADWLVPLGGAAAAMFVTDSSYSRHLSNSPNRIKYSKDLSNYGIAAMVGIGGGLWVLGHVTHDDHKIETGILAGEAAIDSLVPVYAMKYAFGRERPQQDNYRGRFGQGGVSFPSEHAAAAWSIASVVAHEYPGPLTSLFAYGLASAISTSRITGKQHFPSDVLVGSAIGWLEGMYVYRKHHDPRVGGGEWETYAEAHDSRERNAGNEGSPYVPLDSWIYPAMERLAGMGMLDDEFEGLRPWTRSECARLVNEAADQLPDVGTGNGEASGLIEALQREFRPEIEGTGTNGMGAFRLESLYSRTEHISGAPLTDGYTFAQTQFNDFGRPYGEGWSTINGFSTYATRGPWVVYVRGEEQTARSIPAFSLATRELVQNVDNYPQLPLATAQPAINQFSLLDAYVGLTMSNWQISFGKQSLWWGPGDGGPMMFSDNFTPINMFRISRTSPFRLPSILKFLGPVRMEFFIGQLDGHHFAIAPDGVTRTGSWSQLLNPQPFTDGWKFSLRPSANLEIGLTYATIFAGSGIPATVRTFVQSLFDEGETPAGLSNSIRRSGLDFTYRIPKLRKWLTLYGDGFAEDQITFFIAPKARPLPFGYPERAVWRAGIYVPVCPRLPKLDFRAEGVYTDNPDPGVVGLYNHGYYYRGGRYLNGQTNNSNLLGSWIGRQGQGVQTWTNYWFNARDRIQLNFRHQKVSQAFIPGGGTLTDVGVRGDYWLGSVGISAWVQHERWLFPVIQPNVSRNVTATVQVSFEPKKLLTHSVADAKEPTSGVGGRP